ncbi:hypothetical protein, partial [Klebsiella pneumoniae]|uniref:hypothetical protein n=1 Tax=Klebsiella pneumoniae TaxID=573 RepID=UPI001CBD60B2
WTSGILKGSGRIFRTAQDLHAFGQQFTTLLAAMLKLPVVFILQIALNRTQIATWSLMWALTESSSAPTLSG